MMSKTTSSLELPPNHPDLQGDIDLLAAGRLLALGRKRLIKWAKDGRLPGRREGFEWYFTREALLRFATERCLECGEPTEEIDETIFFCSHCASSFAPNNYESDLLGMSPMVQANQQMFLQRMQRKEATDDTAISGLMERYNLSILSAYQIWYQFRYKKEGTHRVGLGDVDFTFDDEDESPSSY